MVHIPYANLFVSNSSTTIFKHIKDCLDEHLPLLLLPPAVGPEQEAEEEGERGEDQQGTDDGSSYLRQFVLPTYFRSLGKRPVLLSSSSFNVKIFITIIFNVILLKRAIQERNNLFSFFIYGNPPE